MNFTKVSSLLLFCAIAFSACGDEYDLCTENRFVTLNGSFYKVIGGVASRSTVSSYYLGSFGGNAITTQQNVSAFSLELNPTIDSTVLIIRLNNSGLSDTVTYRHTSRIETVSPNCGDITAYNLTSIKTTKNYIDSIVIVNNNVNRINAENVRIYHR